MKTILRALARTPGFTAIAIASLALGIGANTAIFSLLDQILLRMLPVRNPAELVFFYSPGPTQGSYSSDEAGGPSFSYPMFRDFQRLQTPFRGVAAASLISASLAYHNSASSGRADAVSGNYFDVLGVASAVGRVFSPDDDRNPGERAVAVLSYSYWISRFGADPSVLNQTLMVNGFPMTIVGVAQKGFESERPDNHPDLYVPVTMAEVLRPGWKGLDDRKNYWLPVFARLKPGVTREQAQAAMSVPYHALIEQDAQLLSHPSPTLLERFRARKLILKPGEYGRGGLRDDSRQPVLILMSITALVLLIACANIANLQLARATARTRDVAVRLAMGASRLQLIRRLLAESCFVSITGGILGLGVAYATMRVLIAAMPTATGLDKLLSAGLDARALVFCLALSVLTGILFGLFPALQTTRPNLASTLKDQSGQSTASASANFFRKALATAQIAISLLLLVSAGLFARTLLNLRKVDLGIRTDHLLVFSVAPAFNRYSDQAAYQFYDQLAARLASIPGVRLVSSGMLEPLAGNQMSTNITVEGYIPPSDDSTNSFSDRIGADYFRTLGTPLVAGREFTLADDAKAPKVAIVNEEFVRHFFAGGNALGRKFAVGGGNGVTPNIEIVGVIKQAKYAEVREDPQPVFYLPHRQVPEQRALNFFLRTAVDPESISGQVRRQVASLDPNLPIREIKTMDAQLDQDLFAERTLSALTLAFAALATLLAALGLYGVLGYNVARRTREIGIRMALGADSTQVRALVLRETAWMVAVGAALGIAAAASAAKLVQSLLYGMKPWDPAVYLASAAVMIAVALASAYLPARRATRVHPMVALRYE